MADPKYDVAQQRRAGWVGLRTLRQRPKVVDHTAEGDPVYEVRSVRLLLRPDASHFNRLVECAKCGREVPGAPVLDAASLEHPVNAVICKTCVQGSALATSRPPEYVVADTGPAPQAVKRPEATRPAPVAPQDGRLSTVEAQLRAVVGQMRELAEGDRSAKVDAGQAEERIRAEVREAVKSELSGLRDPDVSQTGALADQVRQDIGALAEALQVQRRDLSTLVAMADEARAEAERVGRSNSDLAAVQSALDRRLTELAEHVEQVAAAPAASISASAAGDGVEDLDVKVAALTHMVETHRREVAAVMDERVPPDLSPLVRAIEELSQARAQVDDRIDILVREAADQRARLDALLAAVDGGARRLHEVEQRNHDDVDRLSGLLEGQRRGLESMLAQASKPAAPSFAIEGDPDGDDLLDVLERQLLEAERRLAHRSIAAGPD